MIVVCAHLEYGQGYMIFDRYNGDKEVWRSVSGILEHDIDKSSAPDARQHWGVQITVLRDRWLFPTLGCITYA